MPKPALDLRANFAKVDAIQGLRKELELATQLEPGSQNFAEVIEEMMPLVKGCRDKGHSWEYIAKIFQKWLPGLTPFILRKHVFELDPSLKGTVKGVNLQESSESLVPALEEEENNSESVWYNSEELYQTDSEDEDEEPETEEDEDEVSDLDDSEE
jgi:hypothetical protein